MLPKLYCILKLLHSFGIYIILDKVVQIETLLNTMLNGYGVLWLEATEISYLHYDACRTLVTYAD
jgi:hypothetical protein